MKSVLISIQPYWVFLIIANKMGWNIDKEKTVEVRKNYPKDENWDKVVKIYCGKDKKSFNRIPKEYKPFMEKFLGKVVGEFVCDKITDCRDIHGQAFFTLSCMSLKEWMKYTEGHKGAVYAWHISNLVIYDKPRELSEFINCKDPWDCCACDYWDSIYMTCTKPIRPPQSWCYVESEVEGE